MRKQLLGIAVLLFCIMLIIADTASAGSITSIVALIVGIFGLVVAFVGYYDQRTKK